jgi:hypothetical protein
LSSISDSIEAVCQKTLQSGKLARSFLKSERFDRSIQAIAEILQSIKERRA